MVRDKIYEVYVIEVIRSVHAKFHQLNDVRGKIYTPLPPCLVN